MRRFAIYATALLLGNTGCGEKAPPPSGEQSVSKTQPAPVAERQQTSAIAPPAEKPPEAMPALTKAPVDETAKSGKSEGTPASSQETNRSSPIAQISDYFPPLVFGNNERKHRIWARGPSRVLAALAEPKLCSGERKDDELPGAKQWQGHTIYRVLVMGERPYKRLCVRVQKTPAGDYTATLVELGLRVGSHKTGFKPGPIKRQETIKLSQEQWLNFEATLRETKLTEMPTLDGIQGFDGTTCIIETVSSNRYHVVRRWGGRLENRAFNRVARDILKLANVDEKHLGVRNFVEVKDNTVVMARRGDDLIVVWFYDQSKTGAKIGYKYQFLRQGGGLTIISGSGDMDVKDFIDIHKGTFRLKWSAAGKGRGRIYYGGNNTGTTPGLGICVTDLEPDFVKRLGSYEIRRADFALDYWISPFDRLNRSEEDIDRRAAIQALGPISPEAVPALIKMLGHKDDPLCGYATFALARLGRAAVPALIQALADKSYRAREYAAKALGTIGPEAKEAVRALGLALQDKKDTVVEEAAEALGKIGPEAIPVLVNALKADNHNTRYGAAEALGAIGPAAREAVPALIEALLDEHVFVRVYAAEALGKIGPEAEAAVPALVRMFEAASAGAFVGPVVRGGIRSSEPHAWSRYHVVKALGRIGPDARSAVPVLVRALKDRNTSVRSAGAGALGRIGPETDEVVPALLQALQDRDSEFVRRTSAEALGTIGAKATKQSVPALIQALKDRDSFVRRAAIEALGKIGPAAKEAVPALQALLASPKAYVKKAAKEAIPNIDPDAKLEPPPPGPDAKDIF